MLWFLVGVGVIIAVVAVRELLRHPDPIASPDQHTRVPRGGDHTDWSRARDGFDGGGTSGTNGGGSAL